jgi:cytochrome P450
MILYPEAQRKGREEIHRLLGSSRLPKLEDRENLPYIDAILKESLRWHLPAPFDGGRIMLQDEILDGYVLKKNTIVFGNSWWVCHA